MTRAFLSCWLFMVSIWTFASSASTNCDPYGEPQASRCSRTEQRNSDLLDLHTLHTDALNQEHTASYRAEAILVLYYGHNGTVPDQQSSWWQEMSSIIGRQQLVGRRKREHFTSDTDLLHSYLDDIVQAHHDADCVQWLLEQFQGEASSHFQRQNPSFRVPTTPTTTTTTTTPTTTSTTTTTTPTTTPTTTTTTTTTATTAVTPVQCTVCSNLDCLLSPTVQTCSQGFCKVHMTSSQITRGCADQLTCDGFSNVPACAGVETSVLPSGVSCDFCCRGADNCNSPQHAMPTNLYTPGS